MWWAVTECKYTIKYSAVLIGLGWLIITLTIAVLLDFRCKMAITVVRVVDETKLYSPTLLIWGHRAPPRSTFDVASYNLVFALKDTLQNQNALSCTLSRGLCHKAFSEGWILPKYSSKFRTGQSGEPLTSYRSVETTTRFTMILVCLSFELANESFSLHICANSKRIFPHRPHVFSAPTCKLKHQVKPDLLLKPCRSCYV